MTNNQEMLEVFKGSKAKLEDAKRLNETITTKKSEYFSSTKKIGENYSEEIRKNLEHNKVKLEAAHNLNGTIASKTSEYFSTVKYIDENYSEEILRKLEDTKAQLEEAQELDKTIASKVSQYLDGVKFLFEKSNEISSLSLKNEILCQSSLTLAACNNKNIAMTADTLLKQSLVNFLLAQITKVQLADSLTIKMNDIFLRFSSDFNDGMSIAKVISKYEAKIKQFCEMKKIQTAYAEAAKKALDESTAKMNQILEGFSSEFTKGETIAEMISEYETKINQFQEMQKIETANAEALKQAIDDSTVDMNNILEYFAAIFTEGETIAEMIAYYDRRITKFEQKIQADLDENEEIGSDSYLVDQHGHRVEEDYTYSN